MLFDGLVLWGNKTHALFDVWSIEHYIMGINAFMLCKYWRVRGCSMFAQIFLLSLIWEVCEFYMETGFAGGRVKYWFQGVEHPLNRLGTDQLMIYLGALTAQLWGSWGMYLAARVFSIGWLALHIFFLPHSMALQDMITKHLR